VRPAAPALALLLAGCGGCDAVPDGALTDCQQGVVVPARVMTDILFVVDDSGSMAREQAALGVAFRGFIGALAASPVANDFQVAVTTTSVDWPTCLAYDQSGTCTSFQVRTSYDDGTPYAAGAVVAASGRPHLLAAGSPTLVEDFVANVAVGTGGSAKEQGLRALRLALADRIADGRNAGLLRPGARLAVVLVSDEDDCSELGAPAVVYPPSGDGCKTAAERALLPPVQGFADLLVGPLAGERREVLFAALVGVDPVTRLPVQPACNSAGSPAVRYRALVDALGSRGLADDVCQADFSAALAAIASRLDPGQTIPLEGQPPDWRLLRVSVLRSGGGRLDCAVGEPGAGPAEAQALYRAPQGGLPASITFQGACTLGRGDTAQIRVLCAG